MAEKILARGKINLTLSVLGRREDGYHDLEAVFQPVSLADELIVSENELDRLAFSCSVPAFAGEDNLVCRGYARMRERFPGRIPGLDVHLVKNIPSGAGMGGGSADCAALLVWLNDRYGLGLDREGLTDIGVTLGADVPPCMMTHAVLGRGIGEILTDIEIHRDYPLLLLKPDFSFDTGEMFRTLDRVGYAGRENRSREMIAAMEAGDLAGMAANLHNVFEEAVPGRERIQELKDRLVEAGALGSRMTGSGSVVYGIFADSLDRDMAFLKLRNLPGCRAYACEAVNLWW